MAAGEIYVNPLAGLSETEWRFVLAHEMLHAALRHGDRVGARDPYLWNVAADYVINGSPGMNCPTIRRAAQLQRECRPHSPHDGDHSAGAAAHAGDRVAAEADTVYPQAVRQHVSAGGRTEPARRLIR